MRLIPLLIGGIALVAIGLVAALVLVVLPMNNGGTSGGGGGTVITDGGEGGLGDDASFGYIDSEARLELEQLRQEIESLRAEMENMRIDMSKVEAAVRAVGQGTGTDVAILDDGLIRDGDNSIRDKYTSLVLLAARTSINQGLQVAQPSYLAEKLGMPRPDLNDTCQPMTNERLKDKLITDQVGPIRVSMLRPAAESLARVFANIQKADPDLYSLISTAGSLCVRRIRGSQNAVSTHSFGLAVDLNVDGQLDNFTDGKTQLGLTIMADFFNAEGWVWGAGFQREDSMHFEVSRKQLDEWIAAGLL